MSLTSSKRSRHEYTKPRSLLRDLPVELGASCTEFLYVQEQCWLIHTSVEFQRYALVSMKRPRQKLVVLLTKRLCYIGLSKTYAVLDYGRLRPTLKNLMRVCPRVRSLFCSIIQSEKIVSSPLCIEFTDYLHEDAIAITEPRCPLSMLPELPCAKYLEVIDIRMYEYDLEVVIPDITAFQSMKKINFIFAHEYDMQFEGLRKMARAWSQVGEVNVTMMTCHDTFTRMTQEQLRALSSWKGLSSVKVWYTFSRVTQPNELENMRTFLHALPKTINTLALILRMNEAGRSQEEFARGIMKMLKSRFTEHNVKCTAWGEWIEEITMYPICCGRGARSLQPYPA